ncbi:DUF4328 domain-containing protein [Streptomyces sp. NPDC127106]|uniref:DUF4328 domain-containing protein n=1 Tax=Streptomyces sp. NPDC127106 TaxID=3345360 RepID=UPI0036286FD6
MLSGAPGSPPSQPQGPVPGGPYAAAPPAQPYPGQPYGAGLLRSPQGLATALTVLLSVGAAVNLFSSAVSAYTWSAMASLAANGVSVYDTFTTADLLTGIAGLLQFLSFVGTAVVFLVWFHRVRANAQVFRPDGFSQTPGWAIGGWFIPVAHLFLPFRTAREIWEASVQLSRDGSFRAVSQAPVVAWWLAFVVSTVLDRISGQLYLKAETAEEGQDAAAFGLVCDLTTVLAAVLAIVFVRKLTALQHLRATQGPFAAS